VVVTLPGERTPEHSIYGSEVSPVTVRPEGEVFDQSARDLRAQLLQLTAENPTVIVNLSQVTFFASEGVTALVVALRDALRRGHELCIEVVRGTIVHRVLEICGLPFTFVTNPSTFG
jgi:anti-anti-sigma factor